MDDATPAPDPDSAQHPQTPGGTPGESPERLPDGAVDLARQPPARAQDETSGSADETAAHAPGVSSADTPGERPARPGRPWWRRWARRLAVTMAVVIAAVTVASFSYNAATDAAATPPPGLTYVHTGDITTRYRAWGPAAAGAPAVVLVPGAIENADVMAPLAAALAAGGLHVEAYDVRGFGYTEQRPPYDTAAQARQLADFIAARHLDAGGREPVLVGHSSGAGVIAAYLLAHPHGASGVVFLDGDGLTGGVPRLPTWLIINPFRTSAMRLAIRSDWVIRDIYDSQCGPGCPPLTAGTMALWRRPLQVAGAESALWALASLGPAGLDPAGVAQVGRLGLPAAVIFGANDSEYPSGDMAATGQRMHAAVVDTIPGARHLSFISDPRRVAADVTRVVKLAEAREP